MVKKYKVKLKEEHRYKFCKARYAHCIQGQTFIVVDGTGFDYKPNYNGWDTMRNDTNGCYFHKDELIFIEELPWYELPD